MRIDDVSLNLALLSLAHTRTLCTLHCPHPGTRSSQYPRTRLTRL